MSKYKTNGSINRISRAITYIVVVLLLLGIVGVCVNLITRPNGIYLRFGDTVVTDKTGGITVPYDETITLKIENSEDWGAYFVTDCTVKIVPNVDDSHDFDFTVDGNTKPSAFSVEKDLTAAFVENYDGKGLNISADGEFAFKYSGKTIAEILSAVYGGKTVTVDNYELSKYPYIAIKIVSPDGKQTLTVPVLLYIAVDGVTLNPNEVIF